MTVSKIAKCIKMRKTHLKLFALKRFNFFKLSKVLFKVNKQYYKNILTKILIKFNNIQQ